MKQEKGITLISLVIYIIGMVAIIAVVGSLLSFYNNNMVKMNDTSDVNMELSKFTARMIAETKEAGNEITEIAGNTIKFKNGNVYTYQDNRIYENTMVVSQYVKDYLASLEVDGSKQILRIHIALQKGETEITNNLTYVIEETKGQVAMGLTYIINNAGDIAVKAEKDSLIITVGDSNNLEQYFTYTTNGNLPVASIKYTDISNNDTEITNTNSLSVGIHEIKCTITNAKGDSVSETMTIAVEGKADGSWDAVAGVNTPLLMEGMVAVYWSVDGGVTASTTQEGASEIYSRIDANGKPSSTGTSNPNFNWNNWYAYVAGNNSTDTKTSRWANAITSDGSYWVWIPRYKYLITDQPTTASETSAGKVTIQFISTAHKMGMSGYTTSANTEGEILTKDSSGYIVHPAFENGSSTGKNNGFANGEWDSELAGFWVAKYEMSMEDGTGKHVETSSNTIGNVKIGSNIKMVSKPNVSSWRWIQIGQMYQNCINYDVPKKSHMIKNSEWGAVAYLTHSQYGRNRNELNINNSNTYITGNAGNSSTDSAYDGGIAGITNAYNTTAGMLASTTGNIYGVYDMNGGGAEFVAGWNTKSELISNGKAIDGTDYFPSTGTSDRTKTLYDNELNTYDMKNVCRTGDASKEILITNGTSWFNDLCVCVTPNYPFVKRDRDIVSPKYNPGLFVADSTVGGATRYHTCRAVLTK